MKRVSVPFCYVLVVSRDRWGRIKGVHYLPDGVKLRAGASHHRPDIVLTDDTSFTNPIVLHRDGDRVYVHLPNQVITVEKGGRLNLTNVVVEFLPIDGVLPEMTELFRLESELFNPNLTDNLRRFIRLYLAYAGLLLSEKAPESVKDSLLLLVSRMTGLPPEKVVSERKRVLKIVEGEMRDVLSKMKPDEVMHVFRLLFA